MNDVVAAGLELRGHTRERRRLADDLGDAHVGRAAEDARDALAFEFRAGQVARGIGDDEHAELALPEPFGVETRGHEIGCRVAA